MSKLRAVRSPHKKVHPVCEYGATTWAECDKARERVYSEWLAMQQVLLAYKLASEGRRIKGENNVFAQLIDLILGHREFITNKDGNPSESADVKQLMAAIERVKAGDLPVYNLYTIPGTQPVPEEASMPHPDDVAPATEHESVRGSDNRPQSGAFETAPKFAPPAEEVEVVAESATESEEDK